MIQGTLSPSDAGIEDKETNGRIINVEKLLGLQALLNSMLLPSINDVEIAQALQEKEVMDKKIQMISSSILDMIASLAPTL